jgi:uncharacterized protein (TIRG00374 family)
MLKKIILGFAISTLFVYLSFKGIDFEGVTHGFKAAKPMYIIVTLVLLILLQVLRSYRWGVILSPVKKVDQFSLFSVTCVGFLAIVAIPARIGELARPYLISTQKDITMTSALGSIVVERLFDSLAVLITFFVLFLFIPLPTWLINAALFFFAVTLVCVGIIILLLVKKKATLDALAPLLRRLPDTLHHKLITSAGHLIDGFGILAGGRLIPYIALLSLAIWLIDAVAIYSLFYAFEFDLPLSAAFALMVVIVMGIVIPTAPGYIGNWHYFTILGLALFGISRTSALTYGIVLHFLSVGLLVLLGVIFLPFNTFSLSDFRHKFSLKKDA